METIDELRQKWDLRHAEREVIPQPAEVLAGNLHLLPKTGEALDLACGLNPLSLPWMGLNDEATYHVYDIDAERIAKSVDGVTGSLASRSR